MSVFPGVDICTTSTIGILVATGGRILGLASRPVTLHSDHPGCAEEDPAEWWANCCSLIPELLPKAGIGAEDIAGIGVAGMLSAVVLLAVENSTAGARSALAAGMQVATSAPKAKRMA